MGRIEFIDDYDEEKSIKNKITQRDIEKAEKAMERYLKDHPTKRSLYVSEALDEIVSSYSEMIPAEIDNTNELVYTPTGWRGAMKDLGGGLILFVKEKPADLDISVIDQRNLDGYGFIDINLKGTQNNYKLQIVRDPVDNKEKYYFSLFDKINNCGKKCYIGDKEYTTKNIDVDLVMNEESNKDDV